MSMPGESVLQEDQYLEQPQEKRDYWEKGANNDLTPEQQQKLKDQADRAARYRRGDDDYNGEYPRKFDGPIPLDIDHGLVVRNVKQYVADALTPHGDNPNVVAPQRPVGGIIDLNPDPHNPQGPPDGPFSGETNWVCINLAEYMAALLRELRYPVRECNIYLSVGGSYIYQSAALQVWFEGKWHFVDPFTCTYHPAAAFPSGFTNMTTYYWDDVTPVPYKEWRVGSFADWVEFDDDEIGGDLQDRFYPPKLLKPGFRVPPPLPLGGLPGGKVEWIERTSARGRGERSGVYITTQTPGVRMYIVDSQGRITDGDVNEVPGAFRIAAGTRIKYCKQESLGPGENLAADLPPKHIETIFFGTRLFLANWLEIGTHSLTLYFQGGPGMTVQLEHRVLGDVHPVTVKGLPSLIKLNNEGRAAVRFSVVVDPLDAGFHCIFQVLLERGLILPEEYGPATDLIRAARQRMQKWQESTNLETSKTS